MGRPIEYTGKVKKEITDIIFKRMAEGESVFAILNEDGFPSRPTFYSWISEDTDLFNKYMRAMEIRADHHFEEMLKIADETEHDTIVTEDGRDLENREWVSRSRLRVETRKWILSRMNPKKYGDKNTTILEGGEKPIEISFED